MRILFLLITLLWAVPVWAARHDVKAGDNLQTVIDKALPGDEIVIQAGARFAGPFVIPSKTFGPVIVIRSTATLPDRRVTEAELPLMPTLFTSVNDAVLTAMGSGRTNWKFDGINFEPSPTFPSGEAIILEGANAFTFDRINITGSVNGTRRGIRMNGGDIAVVRSRITGIWAPGQDAQALCAWNGKGPYRISDNLLVAAGENVMFGGGDSIRSDYIPADITIENNVMLKDMAWKGDLTKVIKNLFELKSAKRVTVRGNLFARHWGGQGQGGFAVVFTPRNQDGKAPWSVVEDVLFEENAVLDTDRGINITGYDDLAPSGQTTRITIRANVIQTRDIAILASNEIGQLNIYGNRITMPEGAHLSMGKGLIWPATATNTPARSAAFAVSSFLWARNEVPGNTYTHSSDVIGTEPVLKSYTQSYSLSGGEMTTLTRALAVAALLTVGTAPEVAAQAVVGQPVTFAFDWTAPAAPVGASYTFRFEVDGATVPQIVFGPPTGGVIQFVHPPFTAAGTRTARVGVKYTITDATKWRCKGTTVTTVPEIDCAEVMSDPLSFIVSSPTTPAPPKPGNLRIILTPIIASNQNSVGFDMEIRAADTNELIYKDFVIAAYRRTGAFTNSMTLASPYITVIK